MKNIFLKLVITFPLLLASCSSNDSFVEKESYEPNLSVITSTFARAHDNIESKVFYYAFESDASFKGSVDPLSSEQFVYNDDSTAQYNSPANYFFPSYDGYKVTNYISLKQKYFAYYLYQNDTFEFTFLRTDGKSNVESDKLPFYAEVNTIENNGLRAYNISFMSDDDLMKPYTDDVRMYYCLYLLYMTENLPYDVYFSRANIYLLPKDNRFLKKYIRYFNDYQYMHYFDMKQVSDYAKEMNLLIK